MPDTASIQSPSVLHIGGEGTTTFGANQEWYAGHWQQQAGCGPTNCSTLLWYLAATRESCRALCPYNGATRAGFVQLMNDVWHYVTPGAMGVNSTTIFTKGALRYSARFGIALQAKVLKIHTSRTERPKAELVWHFLQDAFKSDLPVAFLNLSNGALANLHSWHWVTLVAAGNQPLHATMYDNGRQDVIDLELWLQSTMLGGGFVTLGPAGSNA